MASSANTKGALDTGSGTVNLHRASSCVALRLHRCTITGFAGLTPYHGQGGSCPRAHCNTARCPPFAAMALVVSLHGHPCSLAQARSQGLTLVHFSAHPEPL